MKNILGFSAWKEPDPTGPRKRETAALPVLWLPGGEKGIYLDRDYFRELVGAPHREIAL